MNSHSHQFPNNIPNHVQSFQAQSVIEQFSLEVENYLQRFPATDCVDIFLHDLNGHLRGKRIDVHQLATLAQGCYFPLSIYAMSLEGQVVETSGLEKFVGEPDQFCIPVLGSLQPNAIHPTTHAQLFLTMQEHDGHDCLLEPRNLLKQILGQLNSQQYYPVMTAELEFYLFKQHSNKETVSQISENQSFDVDALDDNQQILELIKQHAALQGIEIISIVAESSAGQYELNLLHTADILKLADHIMSLKRMIRQLAQQYQLRACFMAKPNLHQAGSGLHFHMSLRDQSQRNVFAAVDPKRDSTELYKVIAGLLELMPASMAILAPNINSFRRFKMGNHVPLEASWGSNNRNVAIRIPCSDIENTRIEYRVAGADANPYLAMSMILIGTMYGLSHELFLVAESDGKPISDQSTFLPNNQLDALMLFQHNAVLKQYLGDAFITLWSSCKQFEYQSIHNQMTVMELQWGI